MFISKAAGSNIAEKSGGSGSHYGFVYDSDEWKTFQFSTYENAYSLCEFHGKKA